MDKDNRDAAEAESVEDEAGGLSKREAGKAERRQRIIHAARELIRETGDTGLSMRALAQRAGVSLATPYNLFGSKRAIVLALLEDVREFRARFQAERPSDPLDRIFAAIDMSVSFYTADPVFYRTLWSAVFDTTNEVREEIYNPKRDAFWRELIQDLARIDAFEDFVDLDTLLHQLDYQFRSIMLDWVVDDIDSDHLVPCARLGYALILRGVAKPVICERLLAHIRENQELVRCGTAKADPLAVLPTGMGPVDG